MSSRYMGDILEHGMTTALLQYKNLDRGYLGDIFNVRSGGGLDNLLHMVDTSTGRPEPPAALLRSRRGMASAKRG
jgi:hypothetical protein